MCGVLCVCLLDMVKRLTCEAIKSFVIHLSGYVAMLRRYVFTSNRLRYRYIGAVPGDARDMRLTANPWIRDCISTCPWASSN